jgi:hypothetical protein
MEFSEAVDYYMWFATHIILNKKILKNTLKNAKVPLFLLLFTQ